MQAKKTLHALEPVPLAKILLKCKKEDALDAEDQPLYIDWENETIKCKWCGVFKGAIEARVINQHVKMSKTHKKERQRHLRPDEMTDPLEGVQDIRIYFQPSYIAISIMFCCITDRYSVPS